MGLFSNLLSREAPGRRRLFIHIGMNKTGTTAIQHTLDERRAQLKRHGLLYPKTGIVKEAHYGLSTALGFSNNAAMVAKGRRRADALRRQLAREVATSGCPDVLISAENFVIPEDVGQVRKFFSDYDCKVLVYLRRHDHWWASLYSQAVKTVVTPPWGAGFEAFHQFRRLRSPRADDYRWLVERWEEVFGSDAIIVRPYEQGQNQPHIVADVLNTVGRPDLIPVVGDSIPFKNERLAARDLLMIDFLQRRELDGAIRRRLIRALMDRPPLDDKGHGVISPILRRRMVEGQAEAYAHIARNYLGREDGRLFYEVSPDPDEPWEPASCPSCEEIVEFIAETLGRTT